MTQKSICKSHRVFSFRRAAVLLASALSGLFLVSVAAPLATAQTPTMLVLRAVPSKLKKGETSSTKLPPMTKEDIAAIKIGGKDAPITGFDPLFKGPHVLQLMIVFDSMQMVGGNGQFDQIKKFVHDLPSNVEVGVGWMLQSKVVIAQPFTMDRDLVGKAFIQKTREEAADPKNDNGNPYSCLRDLVTHWPGADPGKLRAVLVFTDGIILSNAQAQANDQLNPDIEGASQIMQRTGVVPYPFYWMDYPTIHSEGGSLEGQQNFSQLTADTGGEPLYEGQFAPGTFTPLLDKLWATLNSEAVVTVAAPYPAGKFQRLDVKSSRDDIRIAGPDQVMVGNVLGKK